MKDSEKRKFLRYLAMSGSVGIAGNLAGCLGNNQGEEGEADIPDIDEMEVESDMEEHLFTEYPITRAWKQQATEQENGEMVIYHTAAGETVNSFTNAVEEKFPWMNIDDLKLSAREVETRYISEYQADSSQADCVWGRAWNIAQEEMALDVNEIPTYEELPEDAKGGQYWAPWKFLNWTPFRNVDLVSDEEVPQDWMELLDPQWEGEMVAPTSARPMWLRYMEEAYTESWIDELAAQNPSVVDSTGTAVVETAAGSHSMTPYGFLKYLWIEDRGEGQPVDAAPVTRLLAPASMALNDKAPHPNTMKFFHTWYFTDDGAVTQAEHLANECMGTLDTLQCNPDAYYDKTVEQDVVDVSNTIDPVEIDREDTTRRWESALGI